MRKLTAVSLLFIFIFSFQSRGQNPELGKDIIDLETFSIKFNVNDFYKSQIKTHKKSRALYARGKTEQAFSEELLKDHKSVENLDTLHLDSNKYLLLYEMKGMATKDTLATYGNVRFQRLDMVTNEKNKFQSLRAISSTYKDDKKNFNALKDILEKSYGKPQIIKETFEHKEYYEWTTEELVISLILKSDGNTDFDSNLYLTDKREYENLKSNLIGKTKYYWIY